MVEVGSKLSFYFWWVLVKAAREAEELAVASLMARLIREEYRGSLDTPDLGRSVRIWGHLPGVLRFEIAYPVELLPADVLELRP